MVEISPIPQVDIGRIYIRDKSQQKGLEPVLSFLHDYMEHHENLSISRNGQIVLQYRPVFADLPEILKDLQIFNDTIIKSEGYIQLDLQSKENIIDEITNIGHVLELEQNGRNLNAVIQQKESEIADLETKYENALNASKRDKETAYNYKEQLASSNISKLKEANSKLEGQVTSLETRITNLTSDSVPLYQMAALISQATLFDLEAVDKARKTIKDTDDYRAKKETVRAKFSAIVGADDLSKSVEESWEFYQKKADEDYKEAKKTVDNYEKHRINNLIVNIRGIDATATRVTVYIDPKSEGQVSKAVYEKLFAYTASTKGSMENGAFAVARLPRKTDAVQKDLEELLADTIERGKLNLITIPMPYIGVEKAEEAKFMNLAKFVPLKLSELRKSYGNISQKELFEKLGIKENIIRSIANGRIPFLNNRKELTNKLRVPPEEFEGYVNQSLNERKKVTETQIQEMTGPKYVANLVAANGGLWRYSKTKKIDYSTLKAMTEGKTRPKKQSVEKIIAEEPLSEEEGKKLLGWFNY